MKIIVPFVTLTVALSLVGVYSLSSLRASPVTESKTALQSKYDVGAPDAQELLELVNAERSKYGVAPLVMDDRLNQSAQMKADDMVTYNYFGHVNHDGTHGTSYINQTAPGTCSYGSENIRDNNISINTSREAFDAWVVSVPHHNAMLRADFTLTGFGVKNDQVVQHFCLPL